MSPPCHRISEVCPYSHQIVGKTLTPCSPRNSLEPPGRFQQVAEHLGQGLLILGPPVQVQQSSVHLWEAPKLLCFVGVHQNLAAWGLRADRQLCQLPVTQRLTSSIFRTLKTAMALLEKWKMLLSAMHRHRTREK